MAQTYRISAVSPETRNWSSQYGEKTTYKVRFDGHQNVVQMNKNADAPAPKVGDEVYGTIQASEYGDKFKGERKPFPSQMPLSAPRTAPQKDEKAIQAMWAIGQSVAAHTGSIGVLKVEDLNSVGAYADELFAMVDRVKQGSNPHVGDNGADTASDPDWLPSDDL